MSAVDTATAHPDSVRVEAVARRRRDARWALLAGACATFAGAGLIVFHYVAGNDGPNDPEGWFASVGFAAPFIAAGLLAVIGALVNAPWHWWAAGIALVPCSIVSFVMFPLLVPAALLVVLGFRNGPNGVQAVWGCVLAAALIAAFAVVLLHETPAQWNGGSSSDIVTTTEATLSVAVGVCVLVVGWAIAAAPVRRRAAD